MPNKYYITKEAGDALIGKLKSDPSFWNEFINLPKAKSIFSAKMRSCNIPWDMYDDLVTETYCHLFKDGWKKLDEIEEPAKFWGWFAKVVNRHFGFTKNKTTGEWCAKTALKNLLPSVPAEDVLVIDENPADEENRGTVQVADSRTAESDLLWQDYMRQFTTVLDKMKASTRKGFPLYAEVMERIAIRREKRSIIAVDLVRRGLLKGPVKADYGSYTEEEIKHLRDNLNNNIYRRAKNFFNEMALQQRFECVIDIKHGTIINENYI